MGCEKVITIGAAGSTPVAPPDGSSDTIEVVGRGAAGFAGTRGG
jgi:hypothetical protein